MYSCTNCDWRGKELVKCDINEALLCPDCLETIIHDNSVRAIKQALQGMERFKR